MTSVLANDFGTTSRRAILFDIDLNPVCSAQQEFPPRFSASSWVEHDPEDRWNAVADTCRPATDRRFAPALNAARRAARSAGWIRAVAANIV